MTDLWGSPRAEVNESPKKAEASVIANSAIPATNSDLGSTSNQDLDHPPKTKDASRATQSIKPGVTTYSSTGQDLVEIAEPNDSLDSTTTDVPIANAQRDNLERLKAALNEDAQRTREQLRTLGGPHDVRVRVESLLERAKRLFALGKLREARHAAQIAQDLGETARLDFLPDEERPVDLVHRIDDQIQVQSPETNSAATNNSTEAQKSKPVADNPPQVTVAPDDSPARLKTRRDWGYGFNVFRRDRKTPTTDSSGNTQPSKKGSQTDPSQARQKLDVESASKSPEANAVVQANRSYALMGNPSDGVDVEEDGRSRDSALREENISVADVSESKDRSETPTISWAGDVDFPGKSRWDGEADEERRTVSSEDASTPDFEEANPIAKFHDVTQRPTSIGPTQINNREVCYPWGMTLVTLGFGVCGIFAIFCYRRGAI